MVTHEYDPAAMPDDLLRAIGYSSLCYTQTEVVVHMMLGLLGDMDLRAQILLQKQVNADPAMNTLSSLAEWRLPPSQAQRVKRLIRRIRDAKTARNKAVHIKPLIHGQTGELLQERVAFDNVDDVKGAKVPSLEIAPIDIADINANAIEAYNAGLELMGVFNEIQSGCIQLNQPIRPYGN